MARIEGTANGETLTGTDSDDEIFGFAGDDALLGEGGNVRLDCGDGSDFIYHGPGADTIIGGAGFDYVSFRAFTSFMSINLVDPAQNTGLALGDTYASIEGFFLGAGDDVFIGDGLSQSIFGGMGDDRLFGGGGGDFLYGEDGDDLLISGVLADFLVGGPGADRYRWTSNAIQQDQVFGFETGADSIELSLNAFNILKPPTAGDNFIVLNSSDALSYAAGQSTVIYYQDLGLLYADTDGAGGNAANLLAAFGANTQIAASDVRVINESAAPETVLITGGRTFGNLGAALASAGDVDGDGRTDLVIGAPRSDLSGVHRAGDVFLLFGDALFDDLDHVIDVGAGFNGVTIRGFNTEGELGASVRAAGDVDGDGLGDLLIGAPGENAAYLLFGSALSAAACGVIDLAQLGTAGVRITGAGDFGQGLAGGADYDGDGLDDIIVGAPRLNGDGAAYLISGATFTNASTNTLNIEAPGIAAFRFVTEDNGDQLGFDAEFGPDLDGDSRPDIILSARLGDAPDFRTVAGHVYVIYSSTLTSDSGGVLNLQRDRSDVLWIHGVGQADNTGRELDISGDINGDGRNDLLISAERGDPGGVRDAGRAVLIWGDQLPGRAGDRFDIANIADQKFGVSIVGSQLSGSLGFSLAHAGDIDGDGLGDIIVGEPRSNVNGNDTGKVYIIFGSTLVADADGVVVANAPETGAVEILGVGIDDFLGEAVASLGDIDGDGRSDILIGVRNADSPNGEETGAAWFISGAHIARERNEDGVIDLRPASTFNAGQPLDPAQDGGAAAPALVSGRSPADDATTAGLSGADLLNVAYSGTSCLNAWAWDRYPVLADDSEPEGPAGGSDAHTLPPHDPPEAAGALSWLDEPFWW